MSLKVDRGTFACVLGSNSGSNVGEPDSHAQEVMNYNMHV